MKKLVGAAIGVVLLGAVLFLTVRAKALTRLEQTYQPHAVDLPVPFPISEGERNRLGEDAGDFEALVLTRAIERGRHLLDSRYACFECHGRDLGGGTMMDAPPVGRFFGPNLTSGKGGVTAKYTAADWDRLVRHGVKPDGHPTVMPSMDFEAMSDQELSDIIAYVRSVPPVDRELAPPEYGPVGLMLIAKGDVRLSAEFSDLQRVHDRFPPESAESKAFGKHLAQVCTGCHGAGLAGGPIGGGDPSWPPAADLRPTALAGWSYDDFKRAMLEAKSKDGRALKAPMSGIAAYARSFTEVELKALWLYLQSA